MAGGVFSEAQLFGMTIRESATDGSDFTNPAADYRRLFLGEDGQLHVKDSAGAVTDIGSASSELAYAQITSDVTVTATSEGAAQTVVATGSVAYTNVAHVITCYAPRVDCGASGTIVMDLYVDSTILGRLAVISVSSSAVSFMGQMRYTPSAASHTFTWKVWRGTADGTVYAAAGGTGTNVPAFIRVAKA